MAYKDTEKQKAGQSLSPETQAFIDQYNAEAEEQHKVTLSKPDYSMCDGFGRPVDEDIYWRNTGLGPAAIESIKEYHKAHPVQEDGTRLQDEGHTSPEDARE